MSTARYVLHSTFCPHSVFMCFVSIWEQTAIISLYSIDWLVCITETECVYWVVRTGSLNLQKAVPRIRRLVAHHSPRIPGFDPRSVHVRFMVGKVVLDRFSFEDFSFPPFSIITPTLHTLIHQNVALTRRTVIAKPGNHPKSNFNV